MGQQVAMVAYLLNLILVFRILLRTEMVKILVIFSFEIFVMPDAVKDFFIKGPALHPGTCLCWRN